MVWIITWCRIGDKPLSKPMLTRFIDVYMRHLGEMMVYSMRMVAVSRFHLDWDSELSWPQTLSPYLNAIQQAQEFLGHVFPNTICADSTSDVSLGCLQKSCILDRNISVCKRSKYKSDVKQSGSWSGIQISMCRGWRPWNSRDREAVWVVVVYLVYKPGYNEIWRWMLINLSRKVKVNQPAKQ